MATNCHTHQTPEDSQVRRVEENKRDEKSPEHVLEGVLEVAIRCASI